MTIRLRLLQPEERDLGCFPPQHDILTLGSMNGNDVHFEAPGVQPIHAELRYVDPFRLPTVVRERDPDLAMRPWVLRAVSGDTSVNGRPVTTPVPLATGDRLALGEAELEVTVEGPVVPLPALTPQLDSQGPSTTSILDLFAFCSGCDVVLAGEDEGVPYGPHYLCQACDGGEPPRPPIDRFRPVRRLGGGGFANAWLVADPRYHVLRALKVLRLDPTLDPADRDDCITRFVREVELLQALHHPHIVRIHEFGHVAGEYFLVLEYMPGGDLTHRIANGHPLPVQTVIQVGLQVLDAFVYAHGRGLEHRDLKPDNILMDEDGVPRLTDFGLARSVHDTRLSGSSFAMGTPNYMPPEQWDSLEGTDHRADLYAVGATLFHALSGHCLFHDVTRISHLGARVRAPGRPRLDELRPDVPTALADLVARSLAVNREERFQTAQAMRDALAEIQGS